MSCTGRPSRPPLALISCSQIWLPSSACWPAPASEPVCAMEKPILIGAAPPCAKAAGEPKACEKAGVITAALMAVLSWRRVIGWDMTFLPKFWTHRPATVRLPPCESRRGTDLDLASNYLPAEGTIRCLLISRKAATSAGSSKSNYINSLVACTEKRCRMSELCAAQLFGLYVCSSHYFRPLLGIADKQPWPALISLLSSSMISTGVCRRAAMPAARKISCWKAPCDARELEYLPGHNSKHPLVEADITWTSPENPRRGCSGESRCPATILAAHGWTGERHARQVHATQIGYNKDQSRPVQGNGRPAELC